MISAPHLRTLSHCSLAISLACGTQARAQEVARSVLPIREVVIRPMGTPRYAVTLLVNGVPVETGLDTGSVGLRILPRAARRVGVAPGPRVVRYSYGSGVQLDGHAASADLRLGGVGGRVTLQAIDHVSCVDGRTCPAARVPQQAYGLMGSGQPGQGFQAIMGTRLNGGDIPNPLVALGVRRWIVRLPQRGGGGGALILNPDPQETSGFVPLRSGAGVPGTVAGCVMVARPDARRLCGPTLLDTGQPELLVRGAARPPAWQRGVPARLAFPDGAGGRAPAVGFRTGDEGNGARTRFVTSGKPFLNAGTLPFYAYDVLFDQERGIIAVRPNASARGAVRPEF